MNELPFDPANPLASNRRTSVSSKTSKHSIKSQSNASKAGDKSSVSKNKMEPVNAETKESSAADLKNEEANSSKQADSVQDSP